MEDPEPTKSASPERISEGEAHTAPVEEVSLQGNPSSGASSSEETFEAQEEAHINTENITSPAPLAHDDQETGTGPPSSPVQLLGSDSPEKSPAKSSPPQAMLEHPEIPDPDQHSRPGSAHEANPTDLNDADVTRSPSDGSSPIRPMMRKSSLNFASLPAREPLTSNKSLGARMSRTSHIEQTQTSYYPRHTGGKSLGVRQDAIEDDEDAMDVDEDEAADYAEEKTQPFASHNKTYTQRLQDQISMLGKSQPSGTRPSKSIPSLAGTQQSLLPVHAQTSQQARPATEEQPRSPPRYPQLLRTPGAFPEDEEDDWIAPPTTKQTASQSPRLGIGKSHSADVMKGFHDKNTIGAVDLELPHDQPQDSWQRSLRYSPKKLPPLSHQNTTNLGHIKASSVHDVSGKDIFEEPSGQAATTITTTNTIKAVSAANSLQNIEMDEPLKSPSRSSRDSPLKPSALKQVKNKFSSILKGSKGLLASSAALSAEGKASLVNSPSITRPRDQATRSAESLVPRKEEEEPLYPDLTQHMPPDSHPSPDPSSPPPLNNRKTRASAERDRKDQKQKEREEREVQHLAEQMGKLERAREREREKARVFSIEKDEKMAAERQSSLQKEHERATQTPAPKDAMQPIRTSPRKAQTQMETEDGAAEGTAEPEAVDQDVAMADIPTSKPAPPSIPRPTPGQTLKAREIKRPLKPTRDAAVKPKQAPTLIRVNTSSQHSGFHPSNSVLAATLQETLGSSQQQAKAKPGQQSIQTKTSTQSLKSSINSTTGRPKALELAEKRRQEEEKKAQRKRDLKAEMERKREEDRRQEEDRREKERQRAAAEEEAKKAAARQAAVERAKQTKAPPPAVRSQPHGPPAAVSRPPSRLGQSTMHRSQEDVSRPVKTVLSSSTAKMSMKRPLQQENVEDAVQRPTGARSGASQQKEVKRMRMSDEFDAEEEAEIQSYGSSIKGPPVRPSTGFKKVSRARAAPFLSRIKCSLTSQDANKSLFSSGYAPAPQGVTRDIFKAPVTSHHSKSGHPLDMAQVSKGHIPFASSQHGAGPSHKTPARPAGVLAAKSAAKSATRSSPRFQNGENIELPEIQTDDDDDDEDEDEHRGLGVASWADTPELRRELMKQETVDPLQVFGPPAPLKLEEVFKNKDRWNKFRARTSSANWAGTDRLTEDEIRKDLAAREKMRRDGGWSYELSKDMA